MLEFSHKPVMPNECMDALALKDGGVYFDGTVGGGGHSYLILKGSAPSGKLIATDLDGTLYDPKGEAPQDIFRNRN